MDLLRFDDAIGNFAVNAQEETLLISKGMGTHVLEVQLDVKSSATEAAGRVLHLQADLWAPHGDNQRAWLGTAHASLPLSAWGIERPRLRFLLTSAQIIALEAHRAGDLRLQLELQGTLPQATGYPGGTGVTEHITVAESRWNQQLQQLGRAVGVEMFVPFPPLDDPRTEAVGYLQAAQRLVREGDIESAFGRVRKALEYIRENCDWGWPAGKAKEQRTADERWAWIRSALADQASGALHIDAGTKDHQYNRAEAEALISMTAALLRIV